MSKDKMAKVSILKDNYLSVSAPIFNIQSYSIHDGPGIRVTVFEKGCPLHCLWCANPESTLTEPQMMFYSAKCTGCGHCITCCPNNAITLQAKDNNVIAITNRKQCVNCGNCINICTNDAREIAGKLMTVSEVLNEVLKERLFIKASGGGITISGGECLNHPDFTEALLYAAKKAGLHTAVEICCFSSRAVIDKVFKYVDLGLLDIKHINSLEHMRLTGVPNEQILENICYIYHELKIKVIIRVPVITQYNDSDDNIIETARFVAERLGLDVMVHLLPYHRLGESKNESLGKKMNMSIEIPTAEHMQHLKSIVEKFGLKAQIGG